MGQQGVAVGEAPRAASVSLRRGSRLRVGEGVVRVLLAACGAFVVLTTVSMLGFLASTGIRGIHEVGLGQLLLSTIWKPEADLYGGVPLIVGTFASATGAVVLGAVPAV